MGEFDLFIAFIPWRDGGKRRPVLVYAIDGDIASVFSVTSQYDRKSGVIQAQYFKINDWAQAGLGKQSYVDTGRLIDLQKSAFDGKTSMGRLCKADELRLLEFLKK
jgi:hypothetical protein